MSYYLNNNNNKKPYVPLPPKKSNQQPLKSKQKHPNKNPLEQPGSWITCAKECKHILDDYLLTLRLQTCQISSFLNITRK